MEHITMYYTIILILSQLLSNFALISNINSRKNRNVLIDTQALYNNNILKYNLLDSDDQSILAIKEQKLLAIKVMQTKEIITELNNNGIETKSIKDRFQLEDLLTNMHTIQEISNQVKLKNQKKDKGKEAYYLYLQLKKLENIEFNVIINEIMKRNLSCNPMIEERKNLEVLLAKDIISTNIDISYTNNNVSTLIIDTFDIGNKLYNATIKQGNDIINDLQALTTTSYEKDAINFIKYGYNKTKFLHFNENSTSNAILSRNQYLEETIQYLYQLPSFDNIISWTKSKDRDTIIELLKYLKVPDNNMHQYSTFSLLSTQLADTIMIEKHLFGRSSSLEVEEEAIQQPINNKLLITSNDYEHKLINKSKQKRKTVDNFRIEKDLYDSFNKNLGITIANLIVKLENSLLYGFGKLFYGLQHSKDLINNSFMKSLVVFIKLSIGSITDIIIQIAQWSGSEILTTSQTLTIVCGYTILTKKGIIGLSTAFIFIRLILSILTKNSTSTQKTKLNKMKM